MTELTTPAGTIYDRGYRHYEGPREGRGRRVRAIAVAGVRRVLGLKRNWKTKVVPWGLLALAFGPVLAFIGVRVLFAEAADEFFTYAQYLRIVAGLLLLFAATAGPELLCPDRRQNVLALIFTRPVTRADYLLAKLAALLAVVGLIAVVPLVVLFLGNTLTAESAATYLRENLDDLGEILIAGTALTVFYSVVALAAASLTDRRAVATAAGSHGRSQVATQSGRRGRGRATSTDASRFGSAGTRASVSRRIGAFNRCAAAAWPCLNRRYMFRHRPGARFDVTEMQPSPPCAKPARGLRH